MQVTESRPYRIRKRVNVPAGKGNNAAADLIEEETTGRAIISSPLHFCISITSWNVENVDSDKETEIIALTIPRSSTHFSSLELQHSPSSTLKTNNSSQSDELTRQKIPNRTNTANSECEIQSITETIFLFSVHLDQCQ